jgi:hypothetical protein
MYDERTSVLLIRLVGSFFIIFAILGAILVIALPYVQLPAKQGTTAT